ncbi:Peroxiredoxin [Catalinimonas alkaloidigena]|uniref:Peroxiredoxin n=1 Tax=Catalinimonas alkaloidigena TaxID=1075417 RepID=A0A1G9R4Z4_9BACT|nr:redoxin domain-containing protein [Catalinimonas alkaloidigena]SDM18349.1 Peroxiredoxin [Catalinimonas alkaloidigena]
MIRYSTPFLLAALLSACQSGQDTADTSASAPDSSNVTLASQEIKVNPQLVHKTDVKTLELGASAPDFKLPGVDGKYHTLAEYQDAPVLAVIFTCNHCPTAQAYEERIKQLVTDYQSKGVQVIAISPNSPLALLYDELGYTDLGDTYEDMKMRAEDEDFNFPYLYDGDHQAVSIAYGPVATPHAFVFDKDRKLRYVGRLDASEKPGTAQAEDIRAALDDLLAGRDVANPQTKTFGCSTKWAWKNDMKEKVYNEWDAQEVTLETIDEAGIQQLLKNDTDKLRLINVWATWCGPCVVEYPEFVVMERMYNDRPFEFISISADKPEQKDKALKFLQKEHSAVENYIFDKDDKYALMEAVDPDWAGALPYTVLVEPGGKRVYSQQGSIDPLELRRLIVNHPLIGRYY